MHELDWAIGVTTAQRASSTLTRTLDSLRTVGFPTPRLFVDGDTPDPLGDAYPTTYRQPRVGAWGNFWLGLTELVTRQPQADLFMMVQDDVVFCREAREYVERDAGIPAGIGVFSLYTPSCNNGNWGWNAAPVGYGMAGAVTVGFTRESAFAFLGDRWVANHCRPVQRVRNYLPDGRHHVDGAIGEWCRQGGHPASFFSPSLAQHIGIESAMYPGFKGKIKNRFADSFPGEEVAIRSATRDYTQAAQAWGAAQGNPHWGISFPLWARLIPYLKPGLRTLEFGSGLSTKLFASAGCRHTALETDPHWAQTVSAAFPDCEGLVRACPADSRGALPDDLSEAKFDLILWDDELPADPHQIRKISERLCASLAFDGVLVVDDTSRKPETQLVQEVSRILGWAIDDSSAGRFGYAILASPTCPITNIGLPRFT